MTDFSGTFLMTFEDINMADDFGKPIGVDVVYEIEYEASRGVPYEMYSDDEEEYNFSAIDHLFVTDEDGHEMIVALTQPFLERLQEAIVKAHHNQIIEKIWDDIDSW